VNPALANKELNNARKGGVMDEKGRAG